MSWARHHPEMYEEICKRGMGRKIALELDVAEEAADEVVAWVFLSGSRQVRNALLAWAQNEVCQEEADYFAQQMDASMTRREKR